MAVPKRKVTPSRRGNRRSHDSISSHAFGECPECGEMKLPHNVCSHCGFYKNSEIIKNKEQDAA